jgi:hypothetical protein
MYDFGLVGFVSGPTPVPSGESMLSFVSESPVPAVKVAVIVDDSPIKTVAPLDEVMVAVGGGGGVTVRIAGQVPVPLEPVAVPP